MRILSITAQKPHSTGSGVILTELVKGFAGLEAEQAVVCGLMPGDGIGFPEAVDVYPVSFETAELPFPVTGMSDEMPYQSTRYRDLNPGRIRQFKEAFIKRVGEAVEKFAPDIILCHHLYLLTAFVREAFPGKRIFGICHGSDLRQMRKNPLKRDFIVEQISRLDGVLALHAVQKEEIAAIYGISSDNIKVIGVGYNNSIFYSTGTRAEKPPLQLIFAGKVAEKKGVMSLIRSLNLLPCKDDQLILKLAGGSGVRREYEEIRQLAEACRYPILFLGALTQQELAVEFNQCHILILPSFYEGLPLVTVEAMACGLQVIMTDLPGIQEWLSEAAENNKIIYVTPPEMTDTDEPVKDSQGAFEKSLAEAIVKADGRSYSAEVDLEAISWEGVCKKVIDIIENTYK